MVYNVFLDLLQIAVLGGLLAWTVYLLACWYDKALNRRIIQLTATLMTWVLVVKVIFF